MSMYFYLPFLLLCVISSGVRSQTPESIRVNGHEINTAYMDEELQNMMNDVGFPGMSIALIDHNEIVFNKVYGIKGTIKKKPLTTNTVFEACSLSKTYFVYLAHQLVDQGKLDLDKPIYFYLGNDRLKHDQRYKLITPRMILSHSSGIENWESHNQEDLLEILNDPGTAHVYSGEGYNYLAEAVEHILGESHETSMNRLVLEPLKLKNTFLKFEANKPSDFAFGHTAFNSQNEKWKNKTPVPSSAVNSTTADYAKVLIAIFKKLSPERIREIMTPVVPATPNDKINFWGPGFMIHVGAGDTLVTQGGSNEGYKSLAVYSPSKQSGFIYFTNNDRGWTIGPKLNELTTQFESNFLMSNTNETFYPSHTIDLLKTYRQCGKEKMFAQIDKLLTLQRLEPTTLNEIGEQFFSEDKQIAMQVLQKNVQAFPTNPTAFYLMADLCREQAEYGLAVHYLRSAEQLGFSEWPIDKKLISYENELNKRTSCCSSAHTILPGLETIIEAEAFCKASGIQTDVTKDFTGGELIGWTNNGDWIEYQVEVQRSGKYNLNLRLASPQGKGKMDLLSNNKLIKRLDHFPVTRNMDNYQTLSTTVMLEAGRQTFRLNVKQGNFDLNWFSLYAKK